MEGPPRLSLRMSKASGLYREPSQSGHGISTSGRNWTSRLMLPVPSQVGQRRRPVLYEKSPALYPPAFAAGVRA